MIETARAHEWLYGVLSNDATLNSYVSGRVYRRLAPQGATMPYVVFQFQGGHDVQAVGPYRVMSQLVCVVKAVGWVRRGCRRPCRQSRCPQSVAPVPVLVQDAVPVLALRLLVSGRVQSRQSPPLPPAKCPRCRPVFETWRCAGHE